jgi:glyoxylase-like metal-dependent hydrolase (beta-lactamase superfamily II)
MAWRIGAATIEAVTETEITAPANGMLLGADIELAPYRSWLDPFLTEDGHIRMVVQAMLLSVDGLRIVVDTCVGHGRDFGPMAPAFNHLDTDFPGQLTAAGFAPDAVDLVVCTHLRNDHVGWNTQLVDGSWEPSFPNARYVMSRADVDHWSRHEAILQPLEVFLVSVQPLLDRGLVDVVEPPHQLSASVSLIPTPGHSPGHMSVQIESDGARGIITGDLAHSPVQLVRPEWSSLADVDPEEARRTREQLRERVGNEDVLIVGTHYPPPTVGRLRTDATGEWRFD